MTVTPVDIQTREERFTHITLECEQLKVALEEVLRRSNEAAYVCELADGGFVPFSRENLKVLDTAEKQYQKLLDSFEDLLDREADDDDED